MTAAIEHCPVCGDPAHPGESDDYGRCASCARLVVDINGTKWHVVGVELKGAVLAQRSPADAAGPQPVEMLFVRDLKPATRRRIARGIGNYFRELGKVDELRESSPAVTPHAKQITVVNEAVFGDGSKTTCVVTADARGTTIREERRQAIPLTRPCPDCGAGVTYADWDTHACDPETRDRYKASLTEAT